ncbi:MAG: SDR family NAD(P)-dependent oxidoreductase [Phycisphaerales bacterium]
MPKPVVIVTGGTGALGAAVVARLLAGGARIVVPWVAQRELDHFAHAKDVELVQVDLADEAAVVSLYASRDPLRASIHIAGGFAMAPIVDTGGEEFLRLFRLNALTAALCCREAVRAMRRAGGGGRIVNVAARPALVPTGGMIAYSMSKAAVVALTRSLAEEVVSDRILVNAIAPSIMDTPANRAAMPGADHASWPKVEEVAEAIAFLASERNALVSGAVVPVYGRA